ncbi:MAG: PorV/PorQ family protein [Candidatus Neomarinimicrobiota bacterium]
MKFIKQLITILVLVAVLLPLWAQEHEIPEDVSKVATTACQFLKMEVGAEASALGGAAVAAVDDLSALYWNPAGLSKIKSQTFYATYTKLYAGIQHGFVAFGTQIGPSDYFGVSANYVNSGKMEVTTPRYPEGTGEFFTVTDLAAGLTYTRVLTDRLSIGVTGKFIREAIWREVATAFAFDIGSQFDTGLKGIQLGMSITNFGTQVKFDGDDLTVNVDTDPNYDGNALTEARLNPDKWPLPLIFRLGIACDIIGPESEWIQMEGQRLTLRFDANDPMDNYLRFNLGVEYELANILALRGGYHMNYDDASFTAGIGLNLDVNSMPLNIDYAIVNYKTLGLVNQISIQLGI